MTERDIVVELTLQLARDGREPSAADKARNRAALQARLGPPGAAAFPGAGASREVPVALRAQRASRGLWRLVGASTVTGVAGFVLGLLVAPELPPAPSETGAPELVHADDAREGGAAVERGVPDVTAESIREGPSDAAPREREQGVGELPGADVAPRVAASSPEAFAPSVRHDSRAKLPRGTPPRARAVSNARSTGNGPDFLEAVRWLRRAQRAVRRGESALALGLLDELDGRFPADVLGEERQATRVLGLCGTGEDERARELARLLIANSPRSIYAERLRSSCAASAVGSDTEKNDLDGRE